jgi:hypothetical protein
LSISCFFYGFYTFFSILSNFASVSPNVQAVTWRFFVPKKEKCKAFLRVQKNVAEQNRPEGRLFWRFLPKFVPDTVALPYLKLL